MLIVENTKVLIQDEQSISTVFIPLMEINHAITNTFFSQNPSQHQIALSCVKIV